jgi:RNA polymerase sigma factor (sigma-70 family)
MSEKKNKTDYQKLRSFISDACNGDLESVAQLVVEITPLLKVEAQKGGIDRIRRTVDASDIVQDACVSICKNLKSLREHDVPTLLSWALTIVRNKRNAHLRKSYSQKRDRDREVNIHDSRGDILARHQGKVSTPSASIMRLDFRNHILNSLDEEDRQTYELYLLGFTIKEIAKILEVPVNTVRKRIARSIKKAEKLFQIANTDTRGRHE